VRQQQQQQSGLIMRFRHYDDDNDVAGDEGLNCTLQYLLKMKV